jgi:hypothetical protein
MTRQQIRTRAATLNGESLGTPGGAQPFMYDDWIDTACDDIARVVGAYYSQAFASIVSGTARYCLPECYRIDNVSYLDANGNKVELTPTTPLSLDKSDQAWRNDPSGAAPTAYATEGLVSLVLYPAPNFSRTSGLIIEGYFAPGSAGAGGISTWPNAADVCPLPVRAHIGVVWRTAYYRALELGNGEKIAMFEKEFTRAKGLLERESATFTAAIQHRDATDRAPVAPAFNPLDL